MVDKTGPGQNDGFKFESWFIGSIHKKKFDEIIHPINSVLLAIEPSISSHDEFLAEKKEGVGLAKKTDAFLQSNKKDFAAISLKKGSGNSVHQENIKTFCNFLEHLGAEKSEIDDLLFLHWGDGTLDGSAPISQRMPANEVKKCFPEVISSVDGLFERFKRQIVSRALIGSVDGTEPGFLVYGDLSSSSVSLFLAPMDVVIDFHCQQPAESAIVQIGHLNYQNWNRCLKGQDLTSNKHRNDLQFKWPNLRDDMKVLSIV